MVCIKIIYLIAAFLIPSLAFAITIPSGVNWYISYTLTNNQNVAVNSLTPINVMVDAGANPWLWVDNAINAEWFYNNGTVATSWLEGNYLNDSATVKLGVSNTLNYWIFIPGNAFLPAGVASNTINLGFAGNDVSTSARAAANTLMDGVTVGESPNLSIGTQGTGFGYAKLDNGYKVFGPDGFYDNFNGVTTGAEWTKFGTAAGTFTQNNGLDIQITTVTGSTAGVFTNIGTNNGFPSNVVIDTYWKSTNGINTQARQLGYDFGLTSAKTVQQNGYYLNEHASGAANLAVSQIANNGGSSANLATTAFNANGPLSNYRDTFTQSNVVGGASTMISSVYNAFAMQTITRKSVGATNSLWHTDVYKDVWWGVSASKKFTEYKTYWFALRIQPPANIMPAQSNGLPIAAAASVSIGAPSNTLIDANQYQSFLATTSGGTANYAYSFNTFNSISSFPVVNSAVFSGVAATTQLWTFQVQPGDASNSPIKGNVQVVDGVPNTYNSIPSASYTENAALVGTLTYSSNRLADQANYELITATVSGGTYPLTYNFMITNTVYAGTNVIGNYLTTCSFTSNSFLFQLPVYSGSANNDIGSLNIVANIMSGTTTSYNIVITNTIGGNLILTAAAPTETNTILDLGQYTLQTANPAGGTQSYSYQWYSKAGVVAPTCTAGNSVGGATSSTYLANPIATNSYAYAVTDSATTTNTVCSSGDTATVDPTLAASISAPSNSIVDVGQYETFTGTATPGTPNYIWAFNSFNSASPFKPTNTFSVASAAPVTQLWTYYINQFDTSNSPEAANVIITDSPTTPTTVNTIASTTYIINPLLQVDLVWSSNSPGTEGNYETFTGNWFGGTSTYTYNFFVTNAVNGNLVANYLLAGVIAGTVTNTIQLPSTNDGCGVLNINFAVTDTASTPVTNSITNTVTVNGCKGIATTTTTTIPPSEGFPGTTTIPQPTSSNIGQLDIFLKSLDSTLVSNLQPVYSFLALNFGPIFGLGYGNLVFVYGIMSSSIQPLISSTTANLAPIYSFLNLNISPLWNSFVVSLPISMNAQMRTGLGYLIILSIIGVAVLYLANNDRRRTRRKPI